MAIINLDAQTIQSLNSEISSLDNSLTNSYLPELESELSAINSNVQGDELHNIINTINSQFASVKSSLSTELPKLENFLNEQMKSYTQTEEELDAELNAVLQKMAALVGENVSTQNVTNTSNSEMDALKTEVEELKKQNEELSKTSFQKANDEFLREAGNDNAEFANRFKNDWTNVGHAYQDGLVSGVASTLGATLTTAGNGVGYLYNQVVNGAEWVLGAVGLNDLGNAAAWIVG